MPCCYITLGVIEDVQAQVGITAVPFVETNDYVRSKALGGATVAMPHHIGGAHLNPAVIGTPGGMELSTQFSGNRSFPFLKAGSDYPIFDSKFYMPSLSYSTDSWSVAYQMMYFYHDRGELRTPTHPSGSEVPANKEQAHTVAASYQMSDYVSLGVGINFIRSKLYVSGLDVSGRESFVGNSVSVDLGAYGEYPVEISEKVRLTPSVGWSLTDFGNRIRYGEEQSPDPLPMKMRGGFGVRADYREVTTNIEFLKGKVPLSIGLYRSFEKLLARWDQQANEAMGPFRALFNSWDTYQRNFGFRRDPEAFTLGEQISNHGGLEIILFDHLSVREGYYRTAIVDGNNTVNSFGFGLHYDMFTIDYVQSDFNSQRIDENRAFWQLSVRFTTDKVKKWMHSL